MQLFGIRSVSSRQCLLVSARHRIKQSDLKDECRNLKPPMCLDFKSALEALNFESAAVDPESSQIFLKIFFGNGF